MSPTITVIIPTRNRCDTLRFALRTATAIDDDRLEIIVSDNASADGTRDVVEAARDPRIRYLNTGERLGMSQNWEFALSHATGDWIGFIGDDDGMLARGLERLREVIAGTGAAAVRMGSCHYHWPSLRGADTGVLIVPAGTGTRILDSRASLLDVLHARKRYSYLPILYHGGFARRELVDSARGPDGLFFQSRIPDIYSAVALAHRSERYALSERPAAIHGASIHSTGQAMLDRGTGRDRSDSARIFGQENNLPLHPAAAITDEAAEMKMFQLLVVECFLQARDALGGSPEISAAELMRSVLAAQEDSPALRRWAANFARVNGIDPAEGRRGARLARLRHFASKLRDLWSDTNFHSQLSPRLRLPDVAAAARVAERVLAARPSPVAMRSVNLARLLRTRLLG
jgi:hypothetical protein